VEPAARPPPGAGAEPGLPLTRRRRGILFLAMPLEKFLPAVRRWFETRLGAPSAPQREGWPRIAGGRHVLLAAPTGSGKTLAAFLTAIDGLLRQGGSLRDETQILYVSPLKALANDVEKNLLAPLAEIRALDPSLPEVRVAVRTGDTASRDRARMGKRPPHVLVTTPESLYVLLTSAGGRAMLRTVRTSIVDEIHAVARDKRGSHLALSLERLEALAGPVQRIGLSATQKPIGEIAAFLGGADREVAVVDAGHLRKLDLAIEVPPSPLAHVCSHEQWDEVYERIAAQVLAHRTTIVFVNTRKLAERLSARLQGKLPEGSVACHHGSLARERRLDAETRLKTGKLRALVATASLELGIDVGEVDLAIQVGAARSIATFLQRMGRAGHGADRVPKGRLFPVTLDELVESVALLDAVRRGELDRVVWPRAPLDILAQQIVAACVPEPWEEDALFGTFRRAWPYRDLDRATFDSVVALHTAGRLALLHRDGVGGRLLATRRARLAAVTGGGAIPDTGEYRVVAEPDGALVGSVHEDFAVESNHGDILQLGTHSWRIVRIEPGTLRVVDAAGAPPNLPFWIGEAPARTRELSLAVTRVREEAAGFDLLRKGPGEPEIPEAAAVQLREHLEAGRAALGAMPTQRRLVLERFFDEGGGMQLVLHAPFGGRINRALGLALRKRFCRGFGFELQAAANEDAIVLSIGAQTGFPLEEVFDYLHPATARDLLVQALLAQPMFENRWRWNVTRALLVERTRGGKRLPLVFQRMRAADLLAKAFPESVACGENLPPGDLPVPMDHPLVRQTVEDCLHEAMDVDGFLEVLRGLRDGTIERVAVDTAEPSAFARGVLAVRPYGFLDDAPLEERRTQAVMARRRLAPAEADTIGALDAGAVAAVREEAWPRPASAEETHEALGWMGYVSDAEALASGWRPWLLELEAAGRAVREGERWFAAEASRDPKAVLRGRLEALGPVFLDDPVLLELEREGAAMRVRLEGRTAWCDRRLLARIHRRTIDTLRRAIEPVTAAAFERFLEEWQHRSEGRRLEGPAGVRTALRQLAGFEAPVAAWESEILSARVRGYRREWLDEATLSGEFVWGRLWGSGLSAIRSTPLAFVPREDLDAWRGLAGPAPQELAGYAKQVFDLLRARGAVFPQEIGAATRLLPAQVEMALQELVARGLLTGDSFAALRGLLPPPSRRRRLAPVVGRVSLFRADRFEEPPPGFAARILLSRTGLLFRATAARERIPVPWWRLVRELRAMELRGEVRGGRFVAGFDAEQYALPEALPLLRRAREGSEVDAARP